VADYRSVKIQQKKIKKRGETLDLQLVRTKDILSSLGKVKGDQFLVGFALETDDELANAQNKLVSKNLDLIVLNSLRDEGAGFGGSTNKVTFISKSGHILDHDLKSKTEVASDLMEYIIKNLNG
jgi:phosphopantothenoylcysteine decarboxylase/phosphopantothenate--cysteine ligase